MRVGIVSYGVALPHHSVSSAVVAQAQGSSNVGPSLGIKQKTVPAWDEDAITLGTSASLQALERAPAWRDKIGCLFVGSESHPYAVKASGTVIAGALGLPSTLSMADLQFACKAGSQSLQAACMYVRAGQSVAGLAIGADTAQARPGDVLEFTAGAGAAAFVVGSGRQVGVELVGTCSVASDTPDFWRRPGQQYPEHAGRFTADPAYFYHVRQAAAALLEETEWNTSDVSRVVFHTPNGRFPRQIAQEMGFSEQQLAAGLMVDHIGNTYAAATMIALAATLDVAHDGETILMTSYGSGAGADSFAWRVVPGFEERRALWQQLVREQIASLQPVSLAEYVDHRQGSHT